MNNKLSEFIVKQIDKVLSENLQYQDNISLILNTNDEILPEELNDDMYPVFLKISTPALKATDDEILIGITHAHFISFHNLEWQTDGYKVQLKEDKGISAYDKCQNALACIKNNRIGRKLPAMSYCDSQVINLAGTLYKGYIPSIAQLKVISAHLDYINEIFAYLDSEPLRISNVWSSDESSPDTAWALHKNQPEAMCKYADNPEDIPIRTIPIFKKIQKINYEQETTL